jgi:phosphatidylserine decarboxylase
MLLSVLLGIVLALVTTLPAGWKWQLGLARTATAVTVLGLLSGSLVVVLDGVVELSRVVAIALVWALTMTLALGLLLYRFFRDPERLPPDGAGLIVSPAEGEVIYVQEAPGGMLPVSSKHGRAYALEELTRTSLRRRDAIVVGIAMNFLDVHVNRAPIAGRIVLHRHFKGGFGSLKKPGMVFENERATTLIEQGELQVAVVQIASRLVRQISSFVAEGDRVSLGQRTGVIRFGSQVDLVLPMQPGLHVSVRPGEHVRAGQSVIAIQELEDSCVPTSVPEHPNEQGSSSSGSRRDRPTTR